ncbi:MAG: tetratricopeptide repeat protein [Pyrinomonadaceae bacterium]
MMQKKRILSVQFLLSLTVCLIVLSADVSGQIAGGMNETTVTRLGGNNFLAGTVFWPSGTPINTRMPVRLSSPTGGDFTASTDDRGQFIFSGLPEGIYSVVIEGDKDFESVFQQVEIVQSRNRQTYTISIRLREKAKLDLKPAVIKVANAGVPKVAHEYYTKAIALSAKKDHRGAVEQLKLAIAEYPQFGDAYNEMGVQYMRLNELGLADQALQEALKIKPDAFEPLLNRGITLFRQQRYPDAEASLSSAVRVQDTSYIAHYYLGRTLTSLEKYDAAEKSLNTAIELGGIDMKEGHRMLANLFINSGNDKRAIEELETYLKLVPNAPDADKLRTAIEQLKTPRQTSPRPS